MVRSGAAEVSEEPVRRKRGVRDLINELLDQAARTRQGFTPNLLREFEDTGRQARAVREEIHEVRPVRGKEPVRHEEGIESLVFARVQQKGPEQSRTRELTAMLDLAENVETARSPRDLDIRSWTRRGRG